MTPYTNKTLFAFLLTLTNPFDAYDILADNGFDPHETAEEIQMTDAQAGAFILEAL